MANINNIIIEDDFDDDLFDENEEVEFQFDEYSSRQRNNLNEEDDDDESYIDAFDIEEEDSESNLSTGVFDSIIFDESDFIDESNINGVYSTFDETSYTAESLNSSSNITRVWSWPTVSMPYNRQRRNRQVEAIQHLGITDLVQPLNSIADARRRTTFNFFANHPRRRIEQMLRATKQALVTGPNNQPYQCNLHLMVYPSPVVSFTNEMIRELIPLVTALRPRSILLDAEDNWRQQARTRLRYPAGDYSASLNSIRNNLLPVLRENQCLLGFTDILTNDTSAIDLAELCDYIMPQAYSTNSRFRRNRIPAGAWEIRVINAFSTNNRLQGKTIIPALAAWDILKPDNQPNANEYDSMKYVLERVEAITSPSITEIAYWSLPHVYGQNGQRRTGHVWRFLNELCQRTRRLHSGIATSSPSGSNSNRPIPSRSSHTPRQKPASQTVQQQIRPQNSAINTRIQAAASSANTIASIKTAIVQKTVAQISRWRQNGNVIVESSAEGQRILRTDYWPAARIPDPTTAWPSQGATWWNVPWSAAFISFCTFATTQQLNIADVLKRTGAHLRYTWQAYKDRIQNRNNRYHAFQPVNVTIEPGDIIVKSRSNTNRATWTDVTAVTYSGKPTHGDLVVSVTTTSADVIGGNLGNSVRRRTYPIVNGKIDTNSSTNSADKVFAVLKLHGSVS